VLFQQFIELASRSPGYKYVTRFGYVSRFATLPSYLPSLPCCFLR
jgi:hypothetical protein